MVQNSKNMLGGDRGHFGLWSQGLSMVKTVLTFELREALPDFSWENEILHKQFCFWMELFLFRTNQDRHTSLKMKEGSGTEQQSHSFNF